MKDDTYIRVHSTDVQLDPVFNNKQPTSTPQGNHSTPAQPIENKDKEILVAKKIPQEETIPLVSSSQEVQEDDTCKVEVREKSSSFLDEGTDEIEPEWTILDADEFTPEYPELVRLRDHDQDSNNDWPRPTASGSWELLYNMAAAEVNQTDVAGEVTVDGTGPQDMEPQQGLRESEEDELDAGNLHYFYVGVNTHGSRFGNPHPET